MITTNIKTRQTEEEKNKVSGLGLVYEEEAELFPGFIETIRKDAFKESVERNRNRPIKSYFNHDPSSVLATTVSEPPLLVENRDEGIFYEAEIPDTTYGKDLKINLSRKNVQGSSFSFGVDDENTWEDEDGNVHREILQGEIYELGPVTDPAYLQAEAGLRSAEKTLEKYREKAKQSKKSKIFIMRKRLELKSKLY
jgi:HK97 family phage prohead protease